MWSVTVHSIIFWSGKDHLFFEGYEALCSYPPGIRGLGKQNT